MTFSYVICIVILVIAALSLGINLSDFVDFIKAGEIDVLTIRDVLFDCAIVALSILIICL